MRTQRPGRQQPGRVSPRGNNGPANLALPLPAGQEVRASADAYTNSVVVVAPASIVGDVRRLAEQLDRQVPPNVTTRVFRLQGRYAAELAPEVSSGTGGDVIVERCRRRSSERASTAPCLDGGPTGQPECGRRPGSA